MNGVDSLEVVVVFFNGSKVMGTGSDLGNKIRVATLDSEGQ